MAPPCCRVEATSTIASRWRARLAEVYPVELVNLRQSGPDRGPEDGGLRGRRRALGDAPDIHVLPVGNAGNITAYWKGYREYSETTPGSAVTLRPWRRDARGWGLPGCWGKADQKLGHPVDEAETIATGDQDRQPGILATGRAGPRRVRRTHRPGDRRADPSGPPLAVPAEGVFVEPSGRRRASPDCSRCRTPGGPRGATIVCTVTSHGLKGTLRGSALRRRR